MPKRKQVAYSIREKLNTIDRIRNGASRSSRDLNVPESTVRGWVKDEAKLRQFLDEVDTDSGLSRKRARLAENSELDKGLYEFFVSKRNDTVPISGPILQSQALQFNKARNGSEDFKCSAGWLDRWKKRHGITQVNICGESRSADTAAAEEFLPNFQELVETEGYCAEQIFNADETALYYKMLPEDVNMSTLPVQYDFSKNAWMTSSIFKTWFQKTSVPTVRRHHRALGLEEKACLLLDN